MIDLGPLLPERGRFGALYEKINRIQKSILELRPLSSLRTSVRQSAVGTAWVGKRSQGGASGGGGGHDTWA